MFSHYGIFRVIVLIISLSITKKTSSRTLFKATSSTSLTSVDSLHHHTMPHVDLNFWQAKIGKKFLYQHTEMWGQECGGMGCLIAVAVTG